MYADIPVVKDQQTVTAEGKSLSPRIEGVTIRRLTPIEDERGEVMEVYREVWGFHELPLVYVYQVRTRPKAIKGWVIHEKQDDRIFFCSGTHRVVFFDHRPDSPTYEMLNHFVFSERTPSLVCIPKGVFHAIQNIGTTDSIFINMPTLPYNHEDPDKYRLPIKNDLIPFDFKEPQG